MAPTQTPAPTSTPNGTPTLKPTKEPGQTMQPADETPTPAHVRQGFYAEEEDLLISSVKFDKEVEYYSLGMNTIFVAMPDGQSAKEVMPDPKKCEYTVYSHGKKAQVKSISDPVWSNKSFYKYDTDSGYYTFEMTVEQGGKQYSAKVNMVSYTDSTDYYSVDNGLVYRTLIADGKEYELENSLTWKNNQGNWDYYLKSEDVSLHDLLNTVGYKVVVCYADKEYTIDCVVDRYSLYNGNCYIFTPAVLQIGDLRIGSDSQEFTVSDKKQDDFYVLTYTSTQGDVDFYPSDNLFQYHEVLSEEKSLKEIFPDLAKNLQIEQVAYQNTCYMNAVVENVVWNDESYYSGNGDMGYYTFDISVTVNGKKTTQSYSLIEKERMYTVSGILKMEDGTPMPNIYLPILKDGAEYDTVRTNEKGEYSFEASKGTYKFKVGDAFTVKENLMEKDITLPVYQLSGSITRENAPAVDAGFWMKSTGDNQIIYFGTDKDQNYRAYLEKGTYELKQGNQTVDTYEVTGTDTKDFLIKLYRITGNFAKKNLEFVDVNDKKNNVLSFPYNGTYTVYLKPGIYNVIYNDVVFDQIEVTSHDFVKDFSVMICSGRVLDATETELPANKYDNYMVDIEKDGEAYKSIWLGKYIPQKGSGYEIVLPKGTYEFFLDGNSLGNVTITDGDVEKDLCLPIRHVKFQVLDQQNNVIQPESSIGLTNTDTNDYYRYRPEDKSGVLLSLGNYKVDNIEDMLSRGYEFSVTKDTELVEVPTDAVRVSGKCQIAGQEGGIYQIDVSNGVGMITTEAKNGSYEMYLEPGEYSIWFNYKEEEDGKQYTLLYEDLTVSDSPLEKDFEITTGSMSGQLTWKDGTTAMHEKSQLYLYSGQLNYYAELDSDGKYSFSYLPYGTYTLHLNNKELGTVTIDSEQKNEDYTIDGYQIVATVKDANGEFVKDKWIYFSSARYCEYIDNDEGVVVVIVDEPGEYEAYSYAGGEKVIYGTVTVTDKNVTCTVGSE
ncbi:MAG: hypothetical protein MRZ36_01065 [Eubacterium sp.]|nr:hypothetical protein [Eubacterium sp.]